MSELCMLDFCLECETVWDLWDRLTCPTCKILAQCVECDHVVLEDERVTDGCDHSIISYYTPHDYKQIKKEFKHE